MVRASTQSGGTSNAAVLESPTVAPRKRKTVFREVSQPRLSDFSHASPADLLGRYWEFARNPLAGVAAMLVSTIGPAKALPNVTGPLQQVVELAGGLQKAHGRNIRGDIIGTDLSIALPDGYTPTFDLYLQAIGIREEDGDAREVSRSIKQAIRRKIRDLRKPPEGEPPG